MDLGRPPRWCAIGNSIKLECRVDSKCVPRIVRNSMRRKDEGNAMTTNRNNSRWLQARRLVLPVNSHATPAGGGWTPGTRCGKVGHGDPGCRGSLHSPVSGRVALSSRHRGVQYCPVVSVGCIRDGYMQRLPATSRAVHSAEESFVKRDRQDGPRLFAVRHVTSNQTAIDSPALVSVADGRVMAPPDADTSAHLVPPSPYGLGCLW
jgi:hypothetical protein